MGADMGGEGAISPWNLPKINKIQPGIGILSSERKFIKINFHILAG